MVDLAQTTESDPMAPAPAISIRLNDPADDDAFHAWHEVFAAASSHDRGPDAPVWPEAELSAELRTQRTSSMTELYLVRSATEADSAIGAIALTMPLSDNRHRVDAGLYVDPGLVNYQLKNDELDYILDNSGAKLVFADADLLDAVAATTTGAGVQSKDFATLLESATATDTAPAGTWVIRRRGHRRRTAALHLGHHLGAQGSDHDPSGTRPRIHVGADEPRLRTH